MKRWRRCALAAAVAAGALQASAVRAATTSATLALQVEVVGGCEVGDASLDFGTYQSGQADDLVVNTRLVLSNCTVDSVVVELDGGQAGDTRGRRLTGPGGATLSYQLFKGPNLGNMFGNNGDGRTIDMTGRTSLNVPVYGRIRGGQTVPSGTYTDTINVTLTF
ncbi:MAG TPA: SCPU domain-containing protein [Rhodospirillales bacterium]|nr:SCPU domain-containing protein [Rhodospirillales bacterium]